MTAKTHDALQAAHDLLDRIAQDGRWSVADAAGVRDQLAAALKAPGYHIPGPYEIALTLGAALAGSGRFESPGAALQAAWFAVPEFYQARDRYLLEMVPVIYGGLSPDEPDAAADEAYAS